MCARVLGGLCVPLELETPARRGGLCGLVGSVGMFGLVGLVLREEAGHGERPLLHGALTDLESV